MMVMVVGEIMTNDDDADNCDNIDNNNITEMLSIAIQYKRFQTI